MQVQAKFERNQYKHTRENLFWRKAGLTESPKKSRPRLYFKSDFSDMIQKECLKKLQAPGREQISGS